MTCTPKEQPIEERYPVNIWHGWTGGECPLPEGTEYGWMDQDGARWGLYEIPGEATDEHWCGEADGGDNLIAFCVTSYPKPEPRKRTRWVAMAHLAEFRSTIRVGLFDTSDDAASFGGDPGYKVLAVREVTITEGEFDK